MKILNKTMKFAALLLVVLMQYVLMPVPKAYAATAPDLGAADSYAVFGKAGVTNDEGGTTHIWGNVGADSSVTGLVPLQVDGAIITDGDTAGVATAASAAYDNLMSETQGTPAPLDLAGTHTIGPGVYDIAASTFNGALTLDGAGVYIFRSSSSNTTMGSGTMNLINGACASNVFWAISAAMTIDPGAHVEGTIIASTENITLGTNATLVGRAISLTKNVTLLLNQITQPICAAAASPAPTPTPTPAPAAPEICVESEIAVVPTIIESRRVSPTSIFVSWGPYSVTDRFNVRYGPTNGNWLYNADVTGFSTTLNALPSNQSIWIQVAARSNCSLGSYGVPKLVGGGVTSTGQVLGASTLASTGSGNSKLGVILMLLGASVALTSLYAFKKSSL